MTSIPFREIHLDLHTSPAICDVAVDFDPATFARAFKQAHINSVTILARCHHGTSYYPSRLTPVHPDRGTLISWAT